MPGITSFCRRTTAAVARHRLASAAAVAMLAAVAAAIAVSRAAPELPLSQIPPAPGAPGAAHAGRLPPVRVLLAEPAATLRIEIDRPYRIQPVGDQRVLARAARLDATEVAALPDGIRIGDRRLPATRLEIIPESDLAQPRTTGTSATSGTGVPPVSGTSGTSGTGVPPVPASPAGGAGDDDAERSDVVPEPAVWVGDTLYRGRIRLLRLSGGRVAAVNVLPIEDYVASVINSEMPAHFPEAARRAQAIVARTYALYQMATFGPGSYFDLHASTRSQRYRGVQYREGGRRLAAETADSRRIAEATRGLVCTLHGRLFCTYYSAVCGGQTVQGSEVFADAAMLPSVPCDFCRDAPYYRWEAEMPRSLLEESLARYHRAAGRDPGRLLAIQVQPASPTPLPPGGERGRGEGAGAAPSRLAQVRLRHERADFTLSASEFRTEVVGAERLRSANFDVTLSADLCRFSGRGWGHGVGLCQWGARGLALRGHDAAAILRYYYPGMQLARIQ